MTWRFKIFFFFLELVVGFDEYDMQLLWDHSSITSSCFWVFKAHPPTSLMIYSIVNHQKLPFSDTIHPPLWWRNTWMVPYQAETIITTILIFGKTWHFQKNEKTILSLKIRNNFKKFVVVWVRCVSFSDKKFFPQFGNSTICLTPIRILFCRDDGNWWLHWANCKSWHTRAWICRIPTKIYYNTTSDWIWRKVF